VGRKPLPGRAGDLPVQASAGDPCATLERRDRPFTRPCGVTRCHRRPAQDLRARRRDRPTDRCAADRRRGPARSESRCAAPRHAFHDSQLRNRSHQSAITTRRATRCARSAR